MNSNLSMELVKVTEAAALAAGRWTGRGKKDEADGAATQAMRDMFNSIQMSGTVVIGEGEMDEAPMLYIGEKLGTGDGPEIDIAVDPIRGNQYCCCGNIKCAHDSLQSQSMGIYYMLQICIWKKLL